ncbi:MAG TPA: ferritin [Acidobacteriota bacterium]|nr:ferritin [Acidobacteriota bacterium]HOT00607.1 ferritin [Acidobacteriota bacterium]HQF87742.1 ferritin [Acidobacteriota bacterium]HQG92458.1 ferritin [Acidobacteriota bacterium]
MIKDKMLKAINEQINEEYASAYIYLSMSAFFESINLQGFAQWMRVQVREETAHGDKFFKHIVERGGRVALKAIPEPAFEWKSPLDVFQATLKHEQHITACIHKLMDLAHAEKDYAAIGLLQWFVDEQVEEEAHAEEIVQKLTMMGDAKHAIYMLDRELGARGK